MSHLTATRMDTEASLAQAECIATLVEQAKAIRLPEAIIAAMEDEKNAYAQQHMTTEERERLRNVLYRQDLGYAGAYISGNGISFTFGSKIATVADPMKAFQNVFDALDNVLFNGKLVLFYYDTEEEVSLNVKNSKITVSDEA